jgi:hypothetical protein
MVSERTTNNQAEEAWVWREWLALYVESCEQDLDAEERNTLASALPTAVADPDLLPGLVDGRTADEARGLIAFLAGVDDLDRRRVLVADTVRWLHKVGGRNRTFSG